MLFTSQSTRSDKQGFSLDQWAAGSLILSCHLLDCFLINCVFVMTNTFCITQSFTIDFCLFYDHLNWLYWENTEECMWRTSHLFFFYIYLEWTGNVHQYNNIWIQWNRIKCPTRFFELSLRKTKWQSHWSVDANCEGVCWQNYQLNKALWGSK